jgi:predicted  nucleic acid-binding Zn-ribbon protein
MPGKWRTGGLEGKQVLNHIPHRAAQADYTAVASHIARFDPPWVISALDRIAQLERDKTDLVRMTQQELDGRERADKRIEELEAELQEERDNLECALATAEGRVGELEQQKAALFASVQEHVANALWLDEALETLGDLYTKTNERNAELAGEVLEMRKLPRCVPRDSVSIAPHPEGWLVRTGDLFPLIDRLEATAEPAPHDAAAVNWFAVAQSTEWDEWQAWAQQEAAHLRALADQVAALAGPARAPQCVEGCGDLEHRWYCPRCNGYQVHGDHGAPPDPDCQECEETRRTLETHKAALSEYKAINDYIQEQHAEVGDVGEHVADVAVQVIEELKEQVRELKQDIASARACHRMAERRELQAWERVGEAEAARDHYRSAMRQQKERAEKAEAELARLKDGARCKGDRVRSSLARAAKAHRARHSFNLAKALIDLGAALAERLEACEGDTFNLRESLRGKHLTTDPRFRQGPGKGEG